MAAVLISGLYTQGGFPMTTTEGLGYGLGQVIVYAISNVGWNLVTL